MGHAVGIDVGNHKSVVAISKDGIVDAVLNEECNRETPTAVHFAGNQRLFGAACPSFQPKSTISQLKRLVIDDRRLLPYETAAKPDGRLVVMVFFRNQQQEFTASQMMGMLLGHLKRTTSRTVGSPISECVIGVPSYLDDRQEKAYQDAAVIAGLKPLALLHEGHAIAIEYGHYRTGASATAVVFVDVGHCDTQVTVVRFEGAEPTVVGEASASDLGGRDFDETIFGYFVERCKEQYGIDVCSHVRTKARLRAACEKAKKVLSANREAPVTVDCLMDGRDMDDVITREVFESMSSGLVERIAGLCREVLEAAELDCGDVDSVELVGSGSRIPAISRRLTEFFQRGMSRTLNGSECVARGCALRCESLIRSRAVVGKENKDGRPGRKLEAYLSKEEELMKQDREIEQAIVSRYALESMMYAIRNEMRKRKIKTEFDDEVSMELEKMEDYLKGEEEDAREQDYKAKIQELRSVLARGNDINYLNLVDNCGALPSNNNVCIDLEEGTLLPCEDDYNKERKWSPRCKSLGWIIGLLRSFLRKIMGMCLWIKRLLAKKRIKKDPSL